MERQNNITVYLWAEFKNQIFGAGYKMGKINNNTKSVMLFTASMLIFGTIGIFRRYIPLPSAFLACFRGAAGAIFLLLPAKLQNQKRKHKISVRDFVRLMLTGGLMGLNWIFLFEAYCYTSVATATLCYYMQPTIIILLSPIFFKERITLKKGICTIIAVIGMLFVSGIGEKGLSTTSEVRGILFGLTAAALYAAVVIMNKKTPGISGYTKTIIQLFFAAIVLLPYVLIAGQPVKEAFTPFSIGMLFVVGFIHTGVAYALYFSSMDGLSAQTVAVLSYLDPVSALILSAVMLGEAMTVFGIIGAVMIIGAALASEVSRKTVN